MNEQIRESDHELLQYAAKAAKYDFIEKRFPLFPSAFEFYLRSRHPARTSDYPTLWNPLTDDGDAFRLAVKLNLHISVFVDAIGIGTPGDGYVEFKYESDPCAATRRAIVRAAAEIGRNMV